MITIDLDRMDIAELRVAVHMAIRTNENYKKLWAETPEDVSYTLAVEQIATYKKLLKKLA